MGDSSFNPTCPRCGVPEVDVPVTRRPDAPEIKPRVTPPPGVIDIDARAYRSAKLAGDLGPGIYRIFSGNVGWSSDHWERTVSVPARIHPWVRSPQGWLWHRIRHAQVEWRSRVPHPGSRLIVEVWCGPTFFTGGSRRPRPLDLIVDPPARSPRCTWCDTQVPDRRRLPDRLHTLEEVASHA